MIIVITPIYIPVLPNFESIAVLLTGWSIIEWPLVDNDSSSTDYMQNLIFTYSKEIKWLSNA